MTGWAIRAAGTGIRAAGTGIRAAGAGIRAASGSLDETDDGIAAGPTSPRGLARRGRRRGLQLRLDPTHQVLIGRALDHPVELRAVVLDDAEAIERDVVDPPGAGLAARGAVDDDVARGTLPREVQDGLIAAHRLAHVDHRVLELLDGRRDAAAVEHAQVHALEELGHQTGEPLALTRRALRP